MNRAGPRKPLLLLLAATTAGLALYNNLLARRALAVRPLGHFIHLRGTKLHFLEAGNGQPLLLVRGNGARRKTSPQPASSKSRRQISRTCLRQARLRQEHTPGWQTLDRGCPGRPHRCRGRETRNRAYMVVGHSWGAAVALEMARRPPAVLKGTT
ncbi:exported hypothetical protein [Mesorhizobium sp. ORS 3359]|nr:exported hypothetical protein [Mesorhizobium sp. ORS 3359]